MKLLDNSNVRYWFWVLAIGLHVVYFVPACGSEPKQVVAPNPNGADCLAERQKQQLTCIQDFATRPEIEKCIADKIKSGTAPNCTDKAGVAAYVTSRDSGKE